jgi:tRNA pseudouridine38-40 synthase
MPTYFITTAYKGTHYAGSQVQENAITIQGEIEKALHTYLRQPVTLTGSSRTDAGVHAFKNVYHFDFQEDLSPEIVYHLNAILPQDIVLTGLYEVQPGSHSRFQATARTYQYDIYTQKNPFLEGRAWFYPYPLDVEEMNRAAELIVGEHDFSSFAKRGSQAKTTTCCITYCRWVSTPEGYRMEVEGNRFLRGMVRALVGTLVRVGRKKINAEDFFSILQAKDSTRADFAAPAQGLYLVNVSYPNDGSIFTNQFN